jgi:hypothetical protein
MAMNGVIALIPFYAQSILERARRGSIRDHRL